MSDWDQPVYNNKQEKKDIQPHTDCKINYGEWRRALSLPSFRKSIGFPDSILLECFKIEDKTFEKVIWNFNIKFVDKEVFMDKSPYCTPLYGQLSYTEKSINFKNCININFHQSQRDFKHFMSYYLKFGGYDENWGNGLFKR